MEDLKLDPLMQELNLNEKIQSWLRNKINVELLKFGYLNNLVIQYILFNYHYKGYIEGDTVYIEFCVTIRRTDI